VRLVVPPALASSVPEGLEGSNVSVLLIDSDDAWARDIGPFFMEESGREYGVSFRFNSWGRRFEPYDRDAAFGEGLLDAIGLDVRRAPMVLEGGAIEVDGLGTAIVVETSILNCNRNPGASRLDVEAVLGEYLGLSDVIWLPFGLADDSDTDGHVDNVVRFVGPGRVVCQTMGRNSEDTEHLLHNKTVLESARDASGRQLDVVDVPWLPYSPYGSDRPASYCNFYFVNGGLIVPTVGAPSDEDALSLLASVAGRHPIGVDARVLAYGGGGPHCITMPRYLLSTEGSQ
jgi:agmatine deiminase